MPAWVKALLILLAVAAALAVLVRALEPRLAFFPTQGEDATPAALGVPFEAAAIQTRDGERLQAWLLPHEHARAVVLYFHGNGGNLSVWLPVLAGIHRQGYTVAAADYRGYGISTGTPSERGLYRDVDAVVAWAAPLRQPDVPMLFWGRSLGTTMAAYAATRTRPAGLILESGFPDARSVIRASPLLFALSVFSTYRFPTASYAQHAGCPILVMHGDADRVIPFANGRALYEALPEPKRFEIVRGADHNDLVPPDERRYWTAVSEFVSTLR
jgi:fermentation-respiration switch protein FrsA (DUF1100 family)